MKAICFYLFLIFTVYELNAGNLSWKPVSTSFCDTIYQMVPLNEHDVVVNSNTGVYLIEDLKSIKRIDTFFEDSTFVNIMVVSPDNILYVGTKNKGVFSFNQKDLTWKDESYNLDEKNIVNMAIGKNNEITVIKKSPTSNIITHSYRKLSDTSWKSLNKNLDYIFDFLQYNDYGQLFGIDDNMIFHIEKTNDTIYNWVESTNILNQVPNGILKGFAFNKEIFYLLGVNKGINKSIDTGKIYFNYFDGLTPFGNFTRIMLTKKGEIIIASNMYGIFFSNDECNNFERNNDGLEKTNVNTFTILNDGRVFLCVGNNSIYVSEPPSVEPVKIVGWTQAEKYKFRQTARNYINFIKISNDGKSIFTVSRNEFRIWDVETGYLKKFHKFDFNKIVNIEVSHDDKYLLVVSKTSKNMTDYNDFPYNIRNEIYDINNLKLIRSAEFILERKGLLPSHLRILSAQPKYFEDSNTLYFNCAYSLDFHSEVICYGNLLKYNFKDDKTVVKTLSTESIAEYLITKDNHIFASIYRQGKIILSNDEFATSKVLYDKNKDPKNFPLTFSKIDYLQESNTMICGAEEYIYSLNLETKQLSKILNLNGEYGLDTYNYKFNKDKTKIICGRRSGIYIVSYPTMNVLDSLLFKMEYPYNLNFSMNNNSNGFVAGRYDGVMMYFGSDKLSNVEDEINNENKQSEIDIAVYPNPVNEFLNVVSTDIININITDVNGLQINCDVDYLPEKAIINTVQFNSGIYFMTITTKTNSFKKNFVVIR